MNTQVPGADRPAAKATRKFAASAAGILIVLAAFAGLRSESFYPKPIALGLGVPIAILAARWAMNAAVPYASMPTSRSFGKRDNRLARTVTFLSMATVTYLGFVYVAVPLLLGPAVGRMQYRAVAVTELDLYSQRHFSGRRSPRCERLSGYIMTSNGRLHISKCLAGGFPVTGRPASSIWVETVESPFGTYVTSQMRLK